MTKLPAASRLQAIADLLRTGEGIGIAAMAERFSVTMETIRRDLVILEKEGLLTRVHGGRSQFPAPRRCRRGWPA